MSTHPSSNPQSRPFWAGTPTRTIRRGHFWIPGERVEHDGKTFQRGPMFADWEAPEQVTRLYPIVLVHGGGFQGTEWLTTPDGRPGSAQRLVEEGYATVVVDRPGHGRSPYQTDIVGPMLRKELGCRTSTGSRLAERHTGKVRRLWTSGIGRGATLSQPHLQEELR